jgi:hypothetical protein
VFFLDASDKMSLENGLKAIGAAKSKEASVVAARTYLQSNKDWLLVFDNADDPSFDLGPYIRWNHGNIIITSRNDAVKEYAPDSHFEIDRLEVKDAVQLLVRGVEPSSADERTAMAIVEVRKFIITVFCL